MTKISHQKLKLLYLAKILLERTDEDHTITVPEMISELLKFGITAERKSIYDDLEQLKIFGLNVECRKSKTHDYFIATRDFELPELKLLVDSVQSAKFITQKKSMELIKKLSSLTSIHQTKKLQRQIFISNRVKTMNELIYYNIDTIHEAIAANKRICFKYFELTIDKKEKFKNYGRCYIENPIALTWYDEYYYLITYKEKYNNFAHYRVDKMTNTEILDQYRKLPKSNFDLANYSKKAFSMYGGDETEVYIEFSNNLIGVVFDHFGKDVFIKETDKEHFSVRVNVIVSPNFLSWVISFGKDAKIISPDWVIEKILNLTNEASGQYT